MIFWPLHTHTTNACIQVKSERPLSLHISLVVIGWEVENVSMGGKWWTGVGPLREALASSKKAPAKDIRVRGKDTQGHMDLSNPPSPPLPPPPPPPLSPCLRPLPYGFGLPLFAMQQSAKSTRESAIVDLQVGRVDYGVDCRPPA